MIYFRGKLSSELNLIFIKSFTYSPGLLSIFSMRSVILSQSSVYFSNTSLFLSVEAKNKYLFPFFLRWNHLLHQ